MPYSKTIPKQARCDQTLHLVLTAIKSAGIACHVLQGHELTPSSVVLTFDDSRCRRSAVNAGESTPDES
jgi:hypothetical protein